MQNTPQNAAGFSPFQFVGKNLNKLSSTFSDNLPALSVKPSEVLQDKLNALNSVRWAFITSENDKKNKRALCLHLKTSEK